jgi:hypothetical protein
MGKRDLIVVFLRWGDYTPLKEETHYYAPLRHAERKCAKLIMSKPTAEGILTQCENRCHEGRRDDSEKALLRNQSNYKADY